MPTRTHSPCREKKESAERVKQGRVGHGSLGRPGKGKAGRVVSLSFPCPTLPIPSPSPSKRTTPQNVLHFTVESDGTGRGRLPASAEEGLAKDFWVRLRVCFDQLQNDKTNAHFLKIEKNSKPSSRNLLKGGISRPHRLAPCRFEALSDVTSRIGSRNLHVHSFSQNY